jgi:hypothetical protein
MVALGAAETTGPVLTGAPDRLGNPEDGGAVDGGVSVAEVTGALWEEDMAGKSDTRLLALARWRRE